MPVDYKIVAEVKKEESIEGTGYIDTFNGYLPHQVPSIQYSDPYFFRREMPNEFFRPSFELKYFHNSSSFHEERK